MERARLTFLICERTWIVKAEGVWDSPAMYLNPELRNHFHGGKDSFSPQPLCWDCQEGGRYLGCGPRPAESSLRSSLPRSSHLQDMTVLYGPSICAEFQFAGGTFSPDVRANFDRRKKAYYKKYWKIQWNPLKWTQWVRVSTKTLLLHWNQWNPRGAAHIELMIGTGPKWGSCFWSADYMSDIACACHGLGSLLRCTGPCHHLNV